MNKKHIGTSIKVLGAALIIALFSCLYCWNFWDVSGNMSNVDIALTNDDAGYTDSDGEYTNLGDEIISNALEKTEAHFVQVDSSALDDGIQNSGYLLVYRIPENFSADVMSGKTGEPQVTDLEVYRNERYNFIFTQFSTKVTTALQESINSKIAEAYVGGAYDGLNSARDGFNDAADGATQIADGADALTSGLQSATEGARTAVDGAAQLADGAASVADGSASVADGSASVASGASSLASGTSNLASGASNLANGTQQLDDGASALSDGANKLSNGINSAADKLSSAQSGISQLQSGASTLVSGLDSLGTQLSAGAQALSSKQGDIQNLASMLSSGSSAATSLASGAEKAQQCYQAAIAAAQSGGSYDGKTVSEWMALGSVTTEKVSEGATELSTKLSSGSDAVSDAATGISQAADGIQNAADAVGSSTAAGQTLAYGAATLNSGLASASEGLSSAGQGMTALAEGSSTLASSSETLASGAAGVNEGAQSLSNGAGALVNGANTLSDGASTLADGATTLANGATTLSDGAAQLSEKLPSLESGLEEATDGSAEIEDGANTLSTSLSDGADELSENLNASSDDVAEYVGNPTELSTSTYGGLDYYGQGFSPFFMTTALWLGSLIIFFILNPLAAKSKGAGRMRTVLGRLPLYLVVCAIEAALVVWAAYAIGVGDAYNPNPLVFFLTAFAISACFMLIMQFLNMTLGLIGKALAVLILIIQLSCAGGTLPVELGISALAAIKPCLPFTYSIDALREVITYSNLGVIGNDLLVLLGMGLICLALSLATFPLAEKRRDREIRESMAYDLAAMA